MTAPAFELYDVPRRCACGREWVSKSFTPVAEGEVLPRRGTCATCNAREEEQLRDLTRRAPSQGQPMPKPKAPGAVKLPRDPDDIGGGVHWWDD